ncbi:MAG: hypothetical protein KDK41_07255 [Leptospiraceae bacterium]|nr:hypothetical protein [Leptospiraceae bacterium]
MKMKKFTIKFLFYLMLFSSVSVFPRTKLTTLPERNNVRIDIQDEKYTLVEEERKINLLKGKNHIEFAWANTGIQMDSIQFRPANQNGETKVLNVNFPPEGSALFWEVYSPASGPESFRISYLISNLNKQISHEARVDSSEKFLSLMTYYTLSNQTGERFVNASLESGIGLPIKRDIDFNESRKILAHKTNNLNFEKVYRFDSEQYGKNVRLYYKVENKNNKEPKPISAGKVRIYMDNPSGEEAFLGEDWAEHTAYNSDLELFLGEAQEVKVERAIIQEKEKKVKGPVSDYARTYRFKIENYRKESTKLIIQEHLSGEWEIEEIELKEESGERAALSEKAISYSQKIKVLKKDIENLEIMANVPVTGDKKWNLYVTVNMKNRW